MAGNMMERTARIDIREKRYVQAAHPVIEGLTFELRPAEVACIIAPSGAGKSTLLNLLAAIDDDFRGRVDPGIMHASRGIVFQQPRLMPWLNVIDNVLLPVSAREGRNARQRAKKLLRTIGLSNHSSRYPRELSVGMQRRVALVRALLRKPELLLLDEPFVSLDSPTAERARRLLVSETGDTTTILFTHDLHEAVALGDRLLFLSKAPARVVLEVNVNLPGRAEREGKDVKRFCDSLMQEHPKLLAGEVSRNLRVAT